MLVLGFSLLAVDVPQGSIGVASLELPLLPLSEHWATWKQDSLTYTSFDKDPIPDGKPELRLN